jgi:hypothetical protein
MVSQLVCESVGVRGIARVLRIRINTVLRRIIFIANGISKPTIPQDRPAFEVDELWTYITGYCGPKWFKESVGHPSYHKLWF